MLVLLYIIKSGHKTYFFTIFCIFIVLIGSIFKSDIIYPENVIYFILESIFIITIFLYEKLYVTKKIFPILLKSFNSINLNLVFSLSILIIFYFSLKLIRLELDFITQYIFAIFFGLLLFVKTKIQKIFIIIIIFYLIYKILNIPLDPIQNQIHDNFYSIFSMSFIRYGVIFLVFIFLTLSIYNYKKFIYNLNLFTKLFLVFICFIFVIYGYSYYYSTLYAFGLNIYHFSNYELLNLIFGKIYNRFDWVMSYFWKYRELSLLNISIFEDYTIYSKLTSPIIYILNKLNIIEIQNLEIGKDFKIIFFNERGSFNIDLLSWIFIKNNSYFYIILDYFIFYITMFINIFLVNFLFTYNKYINLVIFINFLSSLCYLISSLFQVRNIEILFIIAIINIGIYFFKIYEVRK